MYNDGLPIDNDGLPIDNDGLPIDNELVNNNDAEYFGTPINNTVPMIRVDSANTTPILNRGNENNFDPESYFNTSSHKKLLDDCKIGALERIKYNFIEKIIKPNLLNYELRDTDSFNVDSRKEFLKILTLINNFASYGFYYYLDKYHGKQKRNLLISKIRQQLRMD